MSPDQLRGTKDEVMGHRGGENLPAITTGQSIFESILGVQRAELSPRVRREWYFRCPEKPTKNFRQDRILLRTNSNQLAQYYLSFAYPKKIMGAANSATH